MTYWLSSPAAHAGLLDEIVKIGEVEQKSSNKKQILQALKTIGLAAAGSGVGYGIAKGIQRLAPRFFLAQKPVMQEMVNKAHIGLPILGGLAGILGSRYRTALDEGMFGPPPKSDARR